MLTRRKPELEDIIYAASALDCEGNVSLSRRYNGTVPSWTLKVGIANTNPALTDFLLSCFRGHVHTEAPVKLSKRIIYRWQIHAANAADFLRIVFPYLKLKKAQAELGLFFQENRKCLDLSQQAEVYERIKSLNKGEAPAETKRVNGERNPQSDSPILKETLDDLIARWRASTTQRPCRTNSEA
jgi:hypothetical protein